MAVQTARRLGEIGFAIGALGALLMMAEAGMPAARAWARLRPLGPLLVAVGFVLGIVFIHWG